MTLATIEPKLDTGTVPAHQMEVCAPGRERATVTWSLDDPNSIAKAREVFRLRVGQGYCAYIVGSDDVQEIIRHFDSTAAHIVLHGPLAGG